MKDFHAKLQWERHGIQVLYKKYKKGEYYPYMFTVEPTAQT